MKSVKIYTDGACSGNPGAGGWAAVLLYGRHRKELSGFQAETTNNRMELLAVIKGLEALKHPCLAEVYSDSAYVVNAVENGWIENWRENGWKTAKKEPVKNTDLWERLIKLFNCHQVKFVKVQGHAENAENNRCDALARAAITARA